MEKTSHGALDKIGVVPTRYTRSRVSRAINQPFVEFTAIDRYITVARARERDKIGKYGCGFLKFGGISLFDSEKEA